MSDHHINGYTCEDVEDALLDAQAQVERLTRERDALHKAITHDEPFDECGFTFCRELRGIYDCDHCNGSGAEIPPGCEGSDLDCCVCRGTGLQASPATAAPAPGGEPTWIDCESCGLRHPDWRPREPNSPGGQDERDRG